MRSMLLVVASFLVTILAWGVYGPVLHWGQAAMSEGAGFARLRPFICVGLAYFGIGVVVPALLLKLKGEAGSWTLQGILFSLAGGALGAIGAMGIIMAFTFGGKPVFVMPLVFGGAPVINSFITISMAKRMKDIGPVFGAGLVMVILGATTVLSFAPRAEKHVQEAPVAAEQDSTEPKTSEVVEPESQNSFPMQILSIALVVVCWGAYGPVLHKGQAAMQHSRLRPLLCVGLAYFAIAVFVPMLWLSAIPEASVFNFTGTLWSLSAGAAGAIGALGIILAFNFGGRPIYVMPLVFGGAPVVNTLLTTLVDGLWGEVNSLFLAGLILVIAGAAMVLIFAPKGPPPKAASSSPPGSAKADAEAGDDIVEK